MTLRLVVDDYRVTWEVCEGDPEREIARIAEERGLQLIAMATHGRSGLGRLLMGSVMEAVAADGSDERTIVDGFYVEPVMDPFDSVGSSALAWHSAQE